MVVVVGADTFTGGGTFAASLNSNNYLGFNSNCQDDYHFVPSLNPRERQGFVVPVFACGHNTIHEGSIEVELIKGTSQRKETTVSSVILLETSYEESLLGLVENYPSKCYNPKEIGMEHTSARTSDGGAHYVRIKLYIGQQGWEVARSFAEGLPPFEPDEQVDKGTKLNVPAADVLGLLYRPICAVGLTESLASGAEGRSLTATLFRTDDQSLTVASPATITCPARGICGVMTEQVNFNGTDAATFRLNASHVYGPGTDYESRSLSNALVRNYRP